MRDGPAPRGRRTSRGLAMASWTAQAPKSSLASREGVGELTEDPVAHRAGPELAAHIRGAHLLRDRPGDDGLQTALLFRPAEMGEEHSDGEHASHRICEILPGNRGSRAVDGLEHPDARAGMHLIAATGHYGMNVGARRHSEPPLERRPE